MALQGPQLSCLLGLMNSRYATFAYSASSCKVSLSFKPRTGVQNKKPACLHRAVLCRNIGLLAPMLSNAIMNPNKRLIKCSSTADNRQTGAVESSKLIELPLIPLPLVFFPGMTLPLQIFEFRYRILMQTLLQTDLRFGIIHSDKSRGIANVGCVGEVVKYERLVDDRFFVICKGQERFRVINVVRKAPYLVAEVQWMKDRQSVTIIEQHNLESLVLDVESYMADVIRLSNKLNGKAGKETKDLLGSRFPTPFSFLVASTFEGSPGEQQALLELEDTTLRLERERDTLQNTLNYLAAASAITDAFQYSSFNEN